MSCYYTYPTSIGKSFPKAEVTRLHGALASLATGIWPGISQGLLLFDIKMWHFVAHPVGKLVTPA